MCRDVSPIEEASSPQEKSSGANREGQDRLASPFTNPGDRCLLFEERSRTGSSRDDEEIGMEAIVEVTVWVDAHVPDGSDRFVIRSHEFNLWRWAIPELASGVKNFQWTGKIQDFNLIEDEDADSSYHVVGMYSV